jgi:hypothetical protein
VRCDEVQWRFLGLSLALAAIAPWGARGAYQNAALRDPD